VLGEEPRFTNYTRDFQGCLDYLFFRNATVKAVLSIPDDCELKREVALPNSRFPSDHVALMADFVLR
ncbi:endonuclease/exonuclease/phosphatase family protein, partial [Toxoplasma gondii p89]